MRVVYTAGCFDLLHDGHLNLLRQSRALGDRLIVGVVSDEGAALYKRRPVQSETTRLKVVRALLGVDMAVIQETTDPTPVLELLRPDIMTHGDDWGALLKGQDTLRRLGVEWRTVPYTHGISTSEIRAKMEEAHADV